MGEAAQAGLIFLSDLISVPSTSSSSSSPAQEIPFVKNGIHSNRNINNINNNKDEDSNKPGRSTNDDSSCQDDDDSLSEEVNVGSLDKFQSFSSRAVRKISWQRSLLELDKNLQRICAPSSSSPSASEQTSQSLCNSPVNLYKQMSRANSVLSSSYKEAKMFGNWGSGFFGDEASNASFPFQFSSTPPKPNNDKIPHSRKCPQFLRRADSMWETASQKSIAVRHIETHSKLHNQLLKITGGLKNAPSVPGSPVSPRNSQVESSRNFESSLRGGYIADLETTFQRIDVENMTVQVDGGGTEIEVRCHQIFERSIDVKLQKFKVEQRIDPNCICLLKQDGGLKICRGTKEVIHISYHPQTKHFHLPVIKGDESSKGEYVLVFHVPNEFNHEDLSVKTVDDVLSVSGQKRRYSANYAPQNYKRSTKFSTSVDGMTSYLPGEEKDLLHREADSTGDNHQFQVVIRLPCTVDTRSVCSYLNHHHLLVVKTKGVPM